MEIDLKFHTINMNLKLIILQVYKKILIQETLLLLTWIWSKLKNLIKVIVREMRIKWIMNLHHLQLTTFLTNINQTKRSTDINLQIMTINQTFKLSKNINLIQVANNIMTDLRNLILSYLSKRASHLKAHLNLTNRHILLKMIFHTSLGKIIMLSYLQLERLVTTELNKILW